MKDDHQYFAPPAKFTQESLDPLTRVALTSVYFFPIKGTDSYSKQKSSLNQIDAFEDINKKD